MNLSVRSDEYFMKLAIAEANIARGAGEVPVGAIIVADNQVIAKAHNQCELLQDVTAHAEILAITAAEQRLGSKYLTSCSLYVTLEPCPMCAGALKWAQLDKLIYGAEDNKNGYSRIGRELLHPKTSVSYGVEAKACGQLMKEFFAEKR